MKFLYMCKKQQNFKLVAVYVVTRQQGLQV